MADDGGLATRIVTVGVPGAQAFVQPRSQVSRAVLGSRVTQPGPLHDLFAVLRSLEAARPDLPRVGRALRPSHESVRLGQEPSMAFATAAVASVAPGTSEAPEEAERNAKSSGPSNVARVLVHCFGMLGPNGPLPLHLTEYVWQRVKHHGDHTLARFLDLFHHRMLSFLYRAWVDANPAVSHDRPETDRSPSQLGAFLGVGTSALREKDALGDSARRYYAGQFADPVAHPEGLRALIEDHFGVSATIEEFVGEWAEIPPHCLWRLPDPALGPAAESGRLGLSTSLGSRVWLVQNRFRIVLGPLSRLQFNHVSPGGPDVAALTSMVRGYVGDGMRWDLRLRLLPEAVPTLQLGAAIIGQTSWLWSTGEQPQDDLIFEPLSPAC
jgi:type VI secretion system protein ImpH